MGRPRKLVDTEKLFDLASKGLTNAEIAAKLECSPDTIERNYPEELAEGRNVARAMLRSKQFELAIAGNVTMLIWLGKNMLGQSDKTEVTGKNGEPFYQVIDREELIGKLLGPGAIKTKPAVQ
jgi:hypothetical protein